MTYDGLLLVAILLIATACFLPLTGGEAIRWQDSPPLWLVHKLVAVGVFVVFYGLFWTRQGQTLGMASWRLRVEREDGALLTWRDTVLRLGAAVLSWASAGLGWFWCLLPGRRTWHDALTHTRVVVLAKGARRDDSSL